MRHLIFLLCCFFVIQANSQTNPLWTEKKVKNYLPHMTVPEVESFLNNSDIVIIPIAAIEQHGEHLPLGTDFINGVELCKLIAQERDILVAPILMAGQSPYHMGFPGTITLTAETIIKVHQEAVNSLIQHGFNRFIVMNAHGGNRAISGLIIDQINQTTAGIAVDFDEAIKPFVKMIPSVPDSLLDRHAGTGETSISMYLIPNLVQLDKATTPELTLPEHLENMLPFILKGDPTAKMLFLAEGLKAKETKKKTSSSEMSSTGVWGEINPNKSTANRGEESVRISIHAAINFIDRWNELVNY